MRYKQSSKLSNRRQYVANICNAQISIVFIMLLLSKSISQLQGFYIPVTNLLLNLLDLSHKGLGTIQWSKDNG